MGRFDEFFAKVAERRNVEFRYPLNHLVELVDFCQWLADSGAYAAMTNNAGFGEFKTSALIAEILRKAGYITQVLYD